MSREGDEPDNSPPRSLVDVTEYRNRHGSVIDGDGALYTPAPASLKSDALLELAKSPMSYTHRNGKSAPPLPEEEGDAASDIQEGMRSEADDTVHPAVRHLHVILHVNLLTANCHDSAARTWTA
jgi:hypothetical protein